jgi:hypothetical protein
MDNPATIKRMIGKRYYESDANLFITKDEEGTA